jgi:hypothetical protein
LKIPRKSLGAGASDNKESKALKWSAADEAAILELLLIPDHCEANYTENRGV